MHSTSFLVVSLALLAVCACAPTEDQVIQHIPKETPSATGKDGAESGAAAEGTVSEVKVPARTRREAGQESDLLPSANDVDVSPFGESSFAGHGRIKVLPAYLG